MSGKAVVSLTTGLEDPEKVTVAFLVAVAAAEQQRPTLMFLTKEATRLAATGVIQGVACEGCPPLPELAKALHRSRRPVPGLPHLLQRPAPGRGHPGGERFARRHRAAVGMDRR
jgi:hypothetical protein